MDPRLCGWVGGSGGGSGVCGRVMPCTFFFFFASFCSYTKKKERKKEEENSVSRSFQGSDAGISKKKGEGKKKKKYNGCVMFLAYHLQNTKFFFFQKK